MPDQDMAPARSILDPLTVAGPVKAAAYDVYKGVGDKATFRKRLDALNLPREAKEKLWDAKWKAPQAAPPPPSAPPKDKHDAHIGAAPSSFWDVSRSTLTGTGMMAGAATGAEMG